MQASFSAQRRQHGQNALFEFGKLPGAVGPLWAWASWLRELRFPLEPLEALVQFFSRLSSIRPVCDLIFSRRPVISFSGSETGKDFVAEDAQPIVALLADRGFAERRMRLTNAILASTGNGAWGGTAAAG